MSRTSPLVKMVNLIIADGFRGLLDVHIEPFETVCEFGTVLMECCANTSLFRTG